MQHYLNKSKFLTVIAQDNKGPLLICRYSYSSERVDNEDFFLNPQVNEGEREREKKKERKICECLLRGQNSL